MKVYLIRACDGVHTDKAFLRPPTESELAEVLEKSLKTHGLKNGKPVTREVSYIVVETVGDPEDGPKIPGRVSGQLSSENATIILANKVVSQPSGHVLTGADNVGFEGAGEVILIEDPRHPRYQTK